VILVVAAVLAAAAFGAQRLLVPRRPSSTGITDRLDASLGSLVRDQVRATQRVIDVPVASRDLKLIVRRLRDALPEPRPEIEVMLVDSPEVNAFTIPGNTIYVNTALIKSLASADELAAVLGHELSHAVSKDPLHALVRRLGVAVVLGAATGGRGGGVLTNMAQTMVDMRYGREAEDRADSFSVSLLARAGIPPDSFAEALRQIKDSSPREPEMLKYLDPHSPIDQRIERTRALARQQAVVPRPLGIDWSALIKALPGR